MTVLRDGNELYFLGNYQPPDATTKPTTDIWRSRRVNGAWGTAEKVPAPISTDAGEVYPVIVGDGSLYFTSNRPGGIGNNSLYRAQRLADGSVAAPVLLPPPINDEAGIGDTFVSPDETLMVFGSSRPPSLGASDLFVVFRRSGRPVGRAIASRRHGEHRDVRLLPVHDTGREVLFFSRRQGTAATGVVGDVYWMDAKFLEQFRR